MMRSPFKVPTRRDTMKLYSDAYTSKSVSGIRLKIGLGSGNSFTKPKTNINLNK